MPAIPASACCGGCATPSRTAGRARWRSRSTATPAMANAYEAGAAGLPCAIFRGYRGAGLARVNPNIKSVECPFTGERLAAVPAIRPDVTFIHAQKADRKGNVLVEGIVGMQKEAVLAAKRAVVTVEEMVDDFDDLHPNLCVLPHWTIAAIAVVPGGAHPSYTHGYYGGTTPPIWSGTRSPPTATDSSNGCRQRHEGSAGDFAGARRASEDRGMS